MANNTKVTLRGKAYYAQVFPQWKDNGFNDELKESGGQYVINMLLDEDNLTELRESQSMRIDYPKELVDEEGELITTYRFTRQHAKYSRDSGELLEWASGAPSVFTDTGEEWTLDEHGFINNGADVEVTLFVYKAGRMWGTRLESIKVIENVERKEVA